MIISKNRLQTSKEIEERKHTWNNIIRTTLLEVSKTFQKFLTKMRANGYVRLIDTLDIETAGLQLTVGFKGAEPMILDSYTQSGGERSIATMAFLLALQQHLKSPFRAVDEFDIHMDPINREVIADMLFEEIGGRRTIQYLTITPGRIAKIREDVHVITVQNILGKSEIKVMA
jgi:chromosome segregation protein